jgi:S1-C subfamily serine protease
MKRKSIILLGLFLAPLMSCVSINRSVKMNPPIESYVKISHSLNIISCHPKFEPICPDSSYNFGSVGSGMVIDLIPDQTIVLTAGHVCTADVDTEKVKEYSELLYVTDYQGREHQAFVIKSTPDNGKGSIDACALWVPTLKVDGVELSFYPPKVGQELYYIGSPAGVYHPPVAPIFTGIFSGVLDTSNSMITIPAVGGSSGSAVLDLNNRVVGILWAAHQFHHITIVTNWDVTMIFLRDVYDMYTGPKKPSSGPNLPQPK